MKKRRKRRQRTVIQACLRELLVPYSPPGVGVARGSESASSSSSSSTTTTDEEQPEVALPAAVGMAASSSSGPADTMEAAQSAEAAPRGHNQPSLAHSWGVFRLLPVRRGSSEVTGWQITCTHPRHPPTLAGTQCTRAMSWQSANEEGIVIRSLKHWALQGLELNSREEHKRLPHRPPVATLPSMEDLDRRVPTAWA